MTVVVLGASGLTGRLVSSELSRRGIPFAPAGRDFARLAAVADLPHALPPRRAEATDAASVRKALDGASVLLNLAGPFTVAGERPVAVAVAQRVGYVDSTGEQPFMLRVRKGFDAAARAAGVTVANAFAYEYALGDAACRLAVEGAGGLPVRALHVLYRAKPAHASAATKRSALRVFVAPGVARVHGSDVLEPPGRKVRAFRLPEGARTGVSFPGGEALHVTRWASVPTVRTYAAMRPGRARTLRLVGPFARALLRGRVLAFAERRLVRSHEDPTPEDLAAMRWEVVAEAETTKGTVRALLAGSDPYRTAARLLVEAAVRVAEGKAPAGVVAPTEVVDARRIVEVAGAEARVEGPE